MSEQVEKAKAILGSDWGPEIMEQVTKCAGCGVQIEPQFEPMGTPDYGEGVLISPLCEPCRSKELLWHETHCENCHCELPRIALEWGQMRLCGDGCQEAFGAV